VKRLKAGKLVILNVVSLALTLTALCFFVPFAVNLYIMIKLIKLSKLQ